VNTITTSIANIIAGNESMVTLHDIVGTKDVQPYHGKRHISFKGSISLSSVCFRYDGNPVLEDINLNLQPHAKVAIIGPNGSGKSTITQLVLGFYRPMKGSLYADGIHYDELDIVRLRKHIGVVMQSPLLFSGTILENISYGTDGLNRNKAIHAAQIAMADEFVSKLPQGYETEIGEDGLRLSGGERQRLAIARALLRRPKLLILDEPTNHLDMKAVSELMDSLDNLEERPAILMISHDVSVVNHADEVFQIEKGVLISYGARQTASHPGS
jgi:ATP-binding cassette subfamily B protein